MIGGGLIGGSGAPGAGATPPTVTQIATQASSVSLPNGTPVTVIDDTLNIGASGIAVIALECQMSSTTATASTISITVIIDGVTNSQQQPWGTRVWSTTMPQTPTTNVAWSSAITGLTPGSHHIQVVLTAGGSSATIWQGVGVVTPY